MANNVKYTIILGKYYCYYYVIQQIQLEVMQLCVILIQYKMHVFSV